jgi:hypothetical protein
MKLRRPTLGLFVLIGALALVLALAVWGVVASWRLGGDTPMSVHGWIAMTLGAVFTAALTGGLMWLAFYSSRRGYDDDQER